MEIVKGVIDLEVLNRLAEGNPGLVRHMIEIFIRENPKEIYKLEQALKDSDYRNIEFVAHKMKSSISYSGFDIELRNMLTEMEENAKELKPLEKTRNDFSKLKTICTIGVNELTAVKDRFE